MSPQPPLPTAAARLSADLNPRTDPPLDFPDRALGELTPADYHNLGFMCGLEVHQQLATERKLFCRCPAGIFARAVDAEVLRHMRPTLSELGEYDGTALMEFKTRKEIVYRLARRSVCTYEIDDTPPFEINPQAVRIALEVALRFGLNLVSELHVMRKQYLDGSIPTGFQRTAMVALGGVIPFVESELGGGQELRIRQLSLEEDSCREVSDVGHRIVFRTDRLGVPLTETVTEPDLLTPLDVAAGGRLIADVTRQGDKVRRGAGAARQDVNVSVAGGRRVEIKGVCSHRALPLLVHTEAYRQLNLLRIKARLRDRGVSPAGLALPDAGTPWDVSGGAVDARSLLRRSNFSPLRAAMAEGDMVCAVRLPGFRGLLSLRTQPGVIFAREIADRVRVIACLTPRPFLIHSDVEDFGLSAATWQQLRMAAQADSCDAMVVIWGAEADVATGVREVLARAREAFDGVPSETRQAFADGTTGFERILPGPDRMYPDTDTPPLPIPDSWVAEVASGLAESLWQRRERYRQAGLTAAAASRLAGSRWADLFDDLAPATPAGARRLAAALEKRLPWHWKRLRRVFLPDSERLRPLVAALDRGGPVVHAAAEILDWLVVDEEKSAEEILAAATGQGMPPLDLPGLAARALACRDSLRGNPDDAAVLRWAMGQVMPEALGRVDPAAVRRCLVENLGLEVAVP